jgi:hypothetical protein
VLAGKGEVKKPTQRGEPDEVGNHHDRSQSGKSVSPGIHSMRARPNKVVCFIVDPYYFEWGQMQSAHGFYGERAMIAFDV